MQVVAEIIKGTSFTGQHFQFNLNGSPLDYTGGSVEAIFSYVEDETCKAQTKQKVFNAANGITGEVKANGEFNLLMNTVLDWKVGHWKYRIKFTFADSTVKVYYGIPGEEKAIWIRS